MLPNIMNRQDQAAYAAQTPQRPQLPSISDTMKGNTESRITPVGGQRPVQRMAPDNGQWGGAPRYMTPESGAYNAAASKPMHTSRDFKPQKPYPGQPTRPPMPFSGNPYLSQGPGQANYTKPPVGNIGLPPQPGLVSTGYQGQAQPLPQPPSQMPQMFANNMNQQQSMMNSIMGNYNTLRPIFSENYQMPYIGPRGI